ncbi:MAG TPA: peptidylprolyl isomerase [Acidimicrobiia bacterium]|nr:peptidylprolyl isomerase [Acidimicrobiia bacterium]
MSRAKRTRKKENARVAREARAAAAKREKRRTAVIRFGSAFLVLILIIAFISFITRDDDNSSASDSTTTTTPTTVASDRPTFDAPPPMAIDADANDYSATISTSEGDIEMSLDGVNAPTSVNNFVFLARNGFYDGLMFNRAAKGFVIQTGSPNNTTAGGPGYSVQAELPPNGAGYVMGSVAWAKAGNEAAGTAGSQFFIVTGDGTSLTPDYGYLGIVTSGIEVAQRIESYAPESGDGPPTTDVTINSVTITETPKGGAATTAPTTTES